MSSATATPLPDAVIAAAKKSKELQQNMIDGKTVPSEEITPAIISAETAPPVTQDDKVVDIKKKPGRPKKVVAKPDDKAPPPEVTKAPEHDKENDPEYWKQKFNSLEGMTKSTIKDLQHRNAELQEDKTLTNQILANLGKDKVEPNVVAVAEEITSSPDIPEIGIPEDDIKVWGDEQVSFTQRVVRSEIAPLLNPILNRLAEIEKATGSIDALANQIKSVTTTQNNQVAQTFAEKVDAASPGWEEYVMKGGAQIELFANWATKNKHSKFSDETFWAKLEDAHKNGDSTVVASIVNEFKELAGHVAPPAPVTQRVETPAQVETVAPESIVPSLEEQVVPVDAGGDALLPTGDGGEVEILKDSEVRKFFTDLSQGKIPEEDALKMKRKIALASRERRIDTNA